jgi:hypothetical protein
VASFPGSAAIVAHLRTVVPQVLRDHVHTATFGEPDSFGAVPDGREVGGPYRANGTKHRYVSVWVLHERDQLDLSHDPVASWTKDGSTVLVSDTIAQDGSHLRVYRSTDTSTGGIQVVHLRTDGVIVQAGTDSKPEPGQTGFIVDTTTLTSIATDPRLTF